MESIVCPYCECKVKMNDVDDEGGACPECGAMITGSLLFDQGEGPGADGDFGDAYRDEDEDDLGLDEDDDD